MSAGAEVFHVNVFYFVFTLETACFIETIF